MGDGLPLFPLNIVPPRFLAELQTAATPSHLWIISRTTAEYTYYTCATLTPSSGSLTREPPTRGYKLIALRRRDYVQLLIDHALCRTLRSTFVINHVSQSIV